MDKSEKMFTMTIIVLLLRDFFYLTTTKLTNYIMLEISMKILFRILENVEKMSLTITDLLNSFKQHLCR